MRNDVAVTLDVDWAPDFMTEFALDVLTIHDIKSTWFITHDSDALTLLGEYKEQVEMGIHPNFLPGSSHGESVEDVIKFVSSLVPDAVSVRTHGVVQSGHILSELVRLSNVKMDATIFLPEMPGIQKVVHLTPHGELHRVATYWADDYALLKEKKDWQGQNYLTKPGIKVFNFHPIHVYLNTRDQAHFEAFRNSGINLRTASEKAIAPYVHHGEGVRSFFLSLLKSIDGKGTLMKAFLQ